jgi:hypothetical protein
MMYFDLLENVEVFQMMFSVMLWTFAGGIVLWTLFCFNYYVPMAVGSACLFGMGMGMHVYLHRIVTMRLDAEVK